MVTQAEILAPVAERYGAVSPRAGNPPGRRRSVSRCPTAPASASSPRRRRRSAAPAIVAGSPRTGRSFSASTARAASICGSCSGPALTIRRSPREIAAVWPARTDRGARSSGRNSPSGAFSTRSRACAPILGARCTPGAADGAPHRPHPAPDPTQHRQHRPALRGDRYLAPSRSSRSASPSTTRSPARRARLLGQRGPLGASGLVRLPGRHAAGPLPLLLGARRSDASGTPTSGRTAAWSSATRPRACRTASWRSIPSGASGFR